MKTLIKIAFFIVLSAILFTTCETNNPECTISENNLAFGNVPIGQYEDKTIMIKNTGGFHQLIKFYSHSNMFANYYYKCLMMPVHFESRTMQFHHLHKRSKKFYSQVGANCWYHKLSNYCFRSEPHLIQFQSR